MNPRSLLELGGAPYSPGPLCSGYAVSPALFPQGLAADAQDGRGLGLAPRNLLEHVADVRGLHLAQRRPLFAPRPQRRRLLPHLGWEGGRLDQLAGAVEGRALDGPAQLADVARPRIALERGHRPFREGARLGRAALPLAGEERFRERPDVLRPLAQRRQR